MSQAQSTAVVSRTTAVSFSRIAIIAPAAYIGAQMLSDIASLKIGVVAGLAVDMGTFIYPITFTLRDIVHKVLGKRNAQTLILSAAGINLFMAAYLAWAAGRALGDKAVAITADSASIPESHKRDAAEYARQCGFRHEVIETREFENPDYVRNDANRCFHCKDELFTRLEEVARERGVRHIVYGVNQDDLGDYRPGQQAAKIHQVMAPLVEAGLRKAEIRELARQAGLPFWDRPAAACLSWYS